MAFEVNVKAGALAAELAAGRSVVDRKKTIPVLAHALIEMAGGELSVSSTNTEVSYRGKIESVGAGSGRTTADIETLLALMKSFDEDTSVKFTCDPDDRKLKIEAVGFKSTLQTLDPADFPPLPALPKGKGVTLPRALLVDALRRTRFATDANDTRFYLGGILLDLKASGSALASSDGKRIAVADLPKVKGDTRTLLPIKSAGALLAALEGDGEDVVFRAGENHLFFAIGDRLLISRVIEGKFPPYEQIVPKRGKKTAEVDRASLLSVLRRLRALVDVQRSGVACAIEKGQMRLSARAEIGEADQTITCSYSGAPVALAINAGNVLDFLEASAAETVSVSLNEEKPQEGAMLWESGDDYRNVIAPMRL